MSSVKKSRIVPYTCAEMFALVNDVASYSQFLPYCSASQIDYSTEDELQATLIISAAGMSKSFTTRNLLQRDKMIEMRLIDGPFSHLEGFWRFDPVSNGCKLSFDIEFEFSSRMFSIFLGPIFDQITNKMVDAFCQRAEVMYGPR